MIDLSAFPVVDVHCHPFGRQEQLSADEFVEMISFPGGGAAYMAAGGVPDTPGLRAEIRRLRTNTVYFRSLIRELSHFFGCDPTLDAVVAARNAAVQTDCRSYVAQLFRTCGLTTLVTDFGYPLHGFDHATFIEEMPVEVVPVYRIEPLIVELLASDIGWEEFRRRYDAAIAHALEHEGYRGLKSIIAYRTGLAISPLSRSPDQGMQALDAIRRGTGGEATKKLRDHLFCRALELCMEYDVPMQVHTGVGDFEIQLTQCRPALLMDLLRFPAFRACRVILVHSGYPYHAEAGYMANVLPRVYCDVSEGISFAAPAGRRLFAELLEMAPISKLLYGSDGFNLPEINYLSAMWGKRALGQVLSEMVEADILSEREAYEAGEMILAGNALQLYAKAQETRPGVKR